MTKPVAAVSFISKEQSTTRGPRAYVRVDLIAITTLALIIRLAWVLFGAWESGDSAWYVNVARNIVFHHVFSAGRDSNNLTPTAFRAPLYSAMIAGIWIGDTAPIFAVLLVQVVLSAATVALCYLIARDQFSRGVAVLAATGMALAPMTGYFTATILSETLFTFLLTLALFCWGRERYVYTGIAFGLAMLTRVTLLPFVAMLPLLALTRPWRPYRRGYLTIAALALAIGSVWIIRNAVDFHRFIPIAASGYGTNLLIGSMTTSDADDVPKRKALLSSVDSVSGTPSTDETEFDRVRLRAALGRIRNNPRGWLVARVQQYPRLFIDSGSNMFGSDGVSFRTAMHQRRIGQVVVRSAFIVGNAAVFVLTLIGLVFEWRSLIKLSHLILFPLFLSVIALPLWIEPRYGLPMMPLIAILSAVGFVRGLTNRSGSNNGRARAVTVPGAVAAGS